MELKLERILKLEKKEIEGLQLVGVGATVGAMAISQTITPTSSGGIAVIPAAGVFQIPLVFLSLVILFFGVHHATRGGSQ